jgi:hypothetical protein
MVDFPGGQMKQSRGWAWWLSAHAPLFQIIQHALKGGLAVVVVFPSGKVEDVAMTAEAMSPGLSSLHDGFIQPDGKKHMSIGKKLDDTTIRQHGVHVQVFYHWLESEEELA